MTDINHQVANEVIAFAKHSGKNPCIVLEGLTRINLRLKDHYWRFSWALAQLETFIRYKALAQGIPVLLLSAKYTSQRCPKCGHTEHANRDNIRDRGVEERHQISDKLPLLSKA